METIYTDGMDMDAPRRVARALAALGVLEPHPSRGDEVGENDWKLADGIAWEDVATIVATIIYAGTLSQGEREAIEDGRDALAAFLDTIPRSSLYGSLRDATTRNVGILSRMLGRDAQSKR